MIIEIENLVKRYRKAQENALNSMCLTIPEGEIFGLLGPNGSGKTTTISILCGLLKPTSGHVTIAGFDVVKHLHDVKPLIGLVPQEIALYPSLSLIENLKYFGSLYGLHGGRLKQRIEECVAIASLEKFAKRPISTYSGGMKRRANLVVGIIHEPKIVFLDEPTVNVDPQSRNMIYQNLLDLNKHGVTMIYTTHYLEEAQKLCPELAIIDGGKVITQGAPQQLVEAHPNCQDLGEVFLELTGKDLRE